MEEKIQDLEKRVSELERQIKDYEKKFKDIHFQLGVYAGQLATQGRRY